MGLNASYQAYTGYSGQILGDHLPLLSLALSLLGYHRKLVLIRRSMPPLRTPSRDTAVFVVWMEQTDQ
jgi:hypothetical protein